MPNGSPRMGSSFIKGRPRIIKSKQQAIVTKAAKEIEDKKKEIQQTMEGSEVVNTTVFVTSDYTHYKYKSAIEFAMAVVNNVVEGENIPIDLRMRMAAALLPYTGVKREIMSRISKKEQKAIDAKEAIQNDFETPLAPRILDAAE
jgi:hypothetical protein